MGTMTDGRNYYPGDLVCYSEGHHQWLVTAARWPSKFVPRTALRGKVTSSTRKTVTVLWNHDADPRTHFADNLELLVSRNYVEEEA